MKDDFSPIRYHKTRMKIATVSLSLLTIIIVTAITIVMSF